MGVALIVAAVVLQGRKSKIAGAIALGGVYWIAPAALAPLVATIVALAFGWALLGAAIRAKKKIGLTRWALLAGGALGIFVAYSAVARRSERTQGGEVQLEQTASGTGDYRFNNEQGDSTVKDRKVASYKGLVENNNYGAIGSLSNLQQEAGAYAQLGNMMGQGGLEGVAPVALPLPHYARAVTVSRELVSKERPFVLRLVYVTDLALLPLGAAWLAAIAALVWLHRAQLRALRDRARAYVASAGSAPATPAPAAPP